MLEVKLILKPQKLCWFSAYDLCNPPVTMATDVSPQNTSNHNSTSHITNNKFPTNWLEGWSTTPLSLKLSKQLTKYFDWLKSITSDLIQKIFLTSGRGKQQLKCKFHKTTKSLIYSTASSYLRATSGWRDAAWSVVTGATIGISTCWVVPQPARQVQGHC